MSEPTADRVRVAILGGGCGGLAAAWQLTATPALRERFDVTVYQLGWQLGGKGASGRAPHSTPDGPRGDRIEEHGLHIWFGFYEHAFGMLRGAYEESGLATGEGWWRVPFQRCDSICLYEQRDDGSWARQQLNLPRRGGADRGPPTRPRRAPLARVIARTTRLLANGLRAELSETDPRRGGPAPEGGEPGLVEAVSILDRLAIELDGVDSPLALDADDAAGPLTRGGAPAILQRPAAIARGGSVDQLLDRLSRAVAELRLRLPEWDASDRVRFWRDVLELVAASLAGVFKDDVLWRGFGTLDREDLREWLGRHGAAEQTLARSPVLRGLYDLTFAYLAGDKRQPSLAAGRGLQALLMMINYEGSFMWRMRAGMGDVVFSPLYLALRERGVRFEFFSRVTRLRLRPGRPVIDAVELIREASIVAGEQRYEPVERIGDWWCWPARPDLEQLRDRTPRPARLRHGADFDEVVLAIPVGALPEICDELAGADPRFRQMLDGAETVRTKAFQVWLTRPIGELQAEPLGDGLDPPATSHADPFDTYCDMSHLLAVEGYEGDRGPRAVAYFCSVLPDDAPSQGLDGTVRAAAQRHLEREAAAIWPAAFVDGAFDWEIVFDPLGRAGPARLEAQYFRANVEPTDRYVTTPAGSVDARLDPDGSAFENLVLAGDWTRSGIDGGCVEAAVISGERAGEAIIARHNRHNRHALAPGSSRRGRSAYVEYGSLATAPGPLLCERARLYCFFVRADRTRVQQLCDRVLSRPTGGALRYRVPRLQPVILTFGMIAGLRSLHPDHAGRGSASEPEAALWVPTIAQRFEAGRYVDDHLAIFMPYIWVDDPIAFASGREVYGFAKAQGWMRPLGDPRPLAAGGDGSVAPEPPEELALDVHGVAEYGAGSELGRRRLLTIRRVATRREGFGEGDRGGAGAGAPAGEGEDLASLVAHFASFLEPGADHALGVIATRSFEPVQRRMAGLKSGARTLAQLVSEQAVRHVFLKQIRDAEHGELAALQQVVEARSSVTPGSLRWRRLRGSYELAVASLVSHPLEHELGLAPEQTIRHAFVAEFGFRMEAGVVQWP